MKRIEESYQRAVIEYANLHWWGKYLYHVPNGGLRNKVVAARLKKMGVRAGVFDLHLPIPAKKSIPRYCGLFIEMKSDRKKKLSEAQQWWGEAMGKAGHLCVTCGSVDAAIEILDGYVSRVEDYLQDVLK